MEYWLVARWLFAYLVLFAVGLPLASVVCPRLADRGAGISLPLSLAILGLFVYWVGRLSFGWVTSALGLFVLCGLVVLAYWTERIEIDIKRRPAIETAVVFTLAFVFLVAVRAVDPAAHPYAGEKFLDYGLLRSLLRASHLPPEDVWFAGKPVKYYYGGHMLSALLAELTFTKARYAYNLALAGFYAMLVTAAYGLAGSLGETVGAARSTAGAIGAFFVGFASNLQPLVLALVWTLPRGIGRGIIDVTEIGREGLALTPRQFSYWDASRVIRVTPEGSDSFLLPTEFPLFSWLNGDLHAHMMSTPFMLLVAALCFSYYRTPGDERTRRRLLLCAIAVLGGFIAVINTWSFPTVFGLAWLTLAFSPADPLSVLPDRYRERFNSSAPQTWHARELRRSGGSLVLAAVLSLISIAVSAPFWLGTVGGGRSLALVSEPSPLVSLLIVHGGFLLVFIPFLLGRARAVFDRTTLVISLAVFVLLGAIAAWLHVGAFALIGPIILGTWALLRSDRAHESVGFSTIMILAGAGLVLLVELFYLSDRAGPGRYNTVFKVYMQVWVLWGPPAGAALARIARPRTPLPVQSQFARADRAMVRSWGSSLRVLFVLLLVLSTSIYGSLALANHFTSTASFTRVEDPTLDGLAYIETEFPDEAAAIYWLNQRPGQPTIAAAPGLDTYDWTNPESTLTGLPTIVGWLDEMSYRNQSVYSARVEDVDALYQGSPERTVEILRKYDVQYIYVGPRERERYGKISFDRIDGVNKTFSAGSVVIYAVDQGELDA